MGKAKRASPGKVTKPLKKALDPTRPRASRAASGQSTRPPAVEASVRRAQGSLPAALWRRFVDADLLSQSAALAFYARLGFTRAGTREFRVGAHHYHDFILKRAP